MYKECCGPNRTVEHHNQLNGYSESNTMETNLIVSASCLMGNFIYFKSYPAVELNEIIF